MADTGITHLADAIFPKVPYSILSFAVLPGGSHVVNDPVMIQE